MVVTLENTKNWLKVESNDDDALIENSIAAAEGLVEGILRFPLSDFEGDVPEDIKLAIYFAVSRLYEERNELDTEELVEFLKALLFTNRKAEW